MARIAYLPPKGGGPRECVDPECPQAGYGSVPFFNVGQDHILFRSLSGPLLGEEWGEVNWGPD